MISLVLCFRERVEKFSNLLQTLERTTDDKSKVEIVLAMDEDDQITIDWVRKIAKNHNFQIIVYPRVRSEHFTKDYINPLSKLCSGRWIMNINDDSEFITPGWDTVLIDCMEKAAKKYGDDIFLGLTKDGHQRTGENPMYPHFTSWPVVSKESINAVGYFFHERFRIWGCDHFIANVYRRLNRLVSLTSIHIDHNSSHNKNVPADDNHVRFTAIHNKDPFKFDGVMVQTEADKFKKYLKSIHGDNWEEPPGPLTIY